MDPTQELADALMALVSMNVAGATEDARREAIAKLESLIDWLTHGGSAPDVADAIDRVRP